jgi:hypothetical protein
LKTRTALHFGFSLDCALRLSGPHELKGRRALFYYGIVISSGNALQKANRDPTYQALKIIQARKWTFQNGARSLYDHSDNPCPVTSAQIYACNLPSHQ